MNLLNIRFADSLIAQLSRMEARRHRYNQMLRDRPTGIRVRTREKAPEADLKLSYNRRVAWSSGTSAVLLLSFFLLYPEHHPTVSLGPRVPAIIRLQNIPETVQRTQPPAAPRPVVPLAVEGDEVPEDVTIESTELDLDAIPIDLRLPVGLTAMGPPSDEPMDISDIDYKPHPIRIVAPEYPEVARKSKQDGTVVVRVLVDKEGRVEKVEALSGPKIFLQAAMNAARQFRFRAGKHAGEKRKVWMIMPIEFKLK